MVCTVEQDELVLLGLRGAIRSGVSRERWRCG